MLQIDDVRVKAFTRGIEESFLKSSVGALMFDKFLDKCLTNKFRDGEPPKYVYVCPPTKELLKAPPYPNQFKKKDGSKESLGDYTKVLELGSYPTIFGTPVWRDTTLDGVQLLGIGYENGDNRYPCSYKLDDTDIHGVLGGATGHGKSVALNSVIFAMVLQYPPWELMLTLADAKVVEFKTLGIGKHIPHITGIAATSDADYIISILQDTYQEMINRNSAFPLYGSSKNIKEFRIFTGWTIPQIVVIIDEFTAMFSNAKKKAKQIIDIIDGIGRLGRSTGVHLLLASQELGSDLPKSTLNQIKVRCALGCSNATSEQILGNDEAKTYFGQKGRMIINTNSPAGLKEENRHFRVPFLSSNSLVEFIGELNRIGFEVGFEYNLSFYDQDDIPDEVKYAELCRSGCSADCVYLGEPSFVMNDLDGRNYVRIEYCGEDSENIFIASAQSVVNRRFLKMLDISIGAGKDKDNGSGNNLSISHSVLVADKSLCSSDLFGKDKGDVVYFRSVNDSAYILTVSKGIGRKLLIETDSNVFPNLKCEDSVRNRLLEDSSLLGTASPSELDMSRYYWMSRCLKNPEYEVAFGLKNKSESEKQSWYRDCIKAYVSAYSAYGCKHTKLTVERFGVHYIWLLALEKVLGLGREPKSSSIENLKRIAQDSTEYNVRFIFSTIDTMEIKALAPACRYFLIDGLSSRMQLDLKCADDYPEVKSNKLGILFLPQAEGDKIKKFKKMSYVGEIIGE
jgi:hypothetical protein